jgi:hypothetical protein
VCGQGADGMKAALHQAALQKSQHASSGIGAFDSDPAQDKERCCTVRKLPGGAAMMPAATSPADGRPRASLVCARASRVRCAAHFNAGALRCRWPCSWGQ